MQTEGIRLKTKIIYWITTGILLLLLWCANEGSRPMVYSGAKLQHSVGLIDSENKLVVEEAVAMTGVVASTPQYVMNRGSYTVTLDYTATEQDSVLELWEQGRKAAAWTLDPEQPRLTADFTLPADAKQVQLRINYSGGGSLYIKSLTLTPYTMFYSDTYFLMAALLLGSLCLWRYLTRGQSRIDRQRLVDYAVILGVALLATTPMMQTYLYNGDDLSYHLARLEGLKDGILDGQIPVNIQPDGLRGNGYLNAMYPYLFLYIGAFLRICRVSIGFSYKVLIFLANLGTAACAYAAVKSMSRSRRSVILAVVLYTLMPYRFTNILSRGDLGETLALVFWPLLLAGLYHIVIGERRYWYYVVIGFSGILQSHILSAAFAAAVCVVTALVFCVRVIRERRYVEALKAAGLTVLLNLWYLTPFLYYFFRENLGKDVLRWSSYFEQSINLSNMAQSISLYNKQYFSVGLALLGCVGIGFVWLVCEKGGQSGGQTERSGMAGYLLYLLVLGCVLIYMTTGYFPNKALLGSGLYKNIVTMIQFPWRFLGPASACFVFVGAVGLSESCVLAPYRNIIFAMLIGLNLLVVVTVPTDNSHMPYDSAAAEASKGHESKLASNIGLFYPQEWRLDGVTDDKLTTSVVTSDVNNIAVSGYEKRGTKAALTYTAETKQGFVELPIQNYLGYRAYDENGDRLEIAQGNGGRMRIAVNGDGAQHMIRVCYKMHPLFVLSDLVSALSIGGAAVLLWRRRRTCRMKREGEERYETGHQMAG